VQGSYVTYKFNLTSGRAAKGTFFYVGGVNKRLNGNSSADISGANWICSVDYNTQAGADGIGDKTTGFLHNYNSNGNKNIADGIAVFKGTEVDEKSVPCDAVFYGATITTDVYNPAGYGYRIPDNDLYSTKNLLSGRRSALLRAGNQYVPLSRRRQRCRGVRFLWRQFYAGRLLSRPFGCLPEAGRRCFGIARRHRKRGRRYDLSLIPEGSALRLPLCPDCLEKVPFLSERAFLEHLLPV